MYHEHDEQLLLPPCVSIQLSGLDSAKKGDGTVDDYKLLIDLHKEASDYWGQILKINKKA